MSREDDIRNTPEDVTEETADGVQDPTPIRNTPPSVTDDAEAKAAAAAAFEEIREKATSYREIVVTQVKEFDRLGGIVDKAATRIETTEEALKEAKREYMRKYRAWVLYLVSCCPEQGKEIWKTDFANEKGCSVSTLEKTLRMGKLTDAQWDLAITEGYSARQATKLLTVAPPSDDPGNGADDDDDLEDDDLEDDEDDDLEETETETKKEVSKVQHVDMSPVFRALNIVSFVEVVPAIEKLKAKAARVDALEAEVTELKAKLAALPTNTAAAQREAAAARKTAKGPRPLKEGGVKARIIAAVKQIPGQDQAEAERRLDLKKGAAYTAVKELLAAGLLERRDNKLYPRAVC